MDNERETLQYSIAYLNSSDGSQISPLSVIGEYQETVLSSETGVPNSEKSDYLESLQSLKEYESEADVGDNLENCLHLDDVITTPQKMSENTGNLRIGASTSGVSDGDVQSFQKALYDAEDGNGSEKHLYSSKYMYSRQEAQILSQSGIAGLQKTKAIVLNSKLTEISTSEISNLRTQSLQQSRSEIGHGYGSDNQLHSAEDVDSKPQELSQLISKAEDGNRLKHDSYSNYNMVSQPESQAVSQSVNADKHKLSLDFEACENGDSTSEIPDQTAQRLHQVKFETEDRKSFENQLYSVDDMDSGHETQILFQSLSADQQKLAFKTEQTATVVSTSKIFDQPLQNFQKTQPETKDGKNSKYQFLKTDQIPFQNTTARKKRRDNLHSKEKNKFHTKENLQISVKDSKLSKNSKTLTMKTYISELFNGAFTEGLFFVANVTASAQKNSSSFQPQSDSIRDSKRNVKSPIEENVQTSIEDSKLLEISEILNPNRDVTLQFNGNFTKEEQFSETNVTGCTQKDISSSKPQPDSVDTEDKDSVGDNKRMPQCETTKDRVANDKDVNDFQFQVDRKVTENPISKPKETNVNNRKSGQNAENHFPILDFFINKGYDAWKYFNNPPPSALQTSSKEHKKRKESKNGYRVRVPNIKTLNDAVTYFEMHEMFRYLDVSLEEVRRRRILASEHEEVVRRVDKDLQKQCLQYHPDRIRNRGGSSKEICDAEKLQAALNITRTVISMMSKEFLEDIHIQYKYEFFSQMELSAFGTEDNIRERICEVLKKIGLLSEIIQDNIVGQVQKFIKCCQSCLENFIDFDIDKYEESRDFAIFHLRKCIKEYLKLDEEFLNVRRECREEGLEYLDAVLREMALEKSKDCQFLQELEANKHSLTETLDIFAAFFEMDDYFVLPFAYYLNIVNMGALILRKKSPPRKKLEFVLKVRSPLMSPLSSAVHDVAKKHDLKPLMSLIYAYNIIWYVMEEKHFVKRNKFGRYERNTVDEEAEIQRFNMFLLEVKDFLADKFQLNFYDVRSSKLHLMEKLAKFKVEDTSVYRKAEDRISRHMEDFKKDSEEKRRELSEMKRASEELQNEMRAKSMRLDEIFEALARKSNCSEELKAEFASE